MSQDIQQHESYPQSDLPAQSTLALVSLISSILSWVGLFGVGGLVGVITGHMAINEINRSKGRLTGSGVARAGLILGYVNIALTVIGICLFIILPLMGLTLLPICAIPFVNE